MFKVRNPHKNHDTCTTHIFWRSGKVFDLGLKGSWFETHRRHCVCRTVPQLSTGSILDDRKSSRLTEKLLAGV